MNLVIEGKHNMLNNNVLRKSGWVLRPTLIRIKDCISMFYITLFLFKESENARHRIFDC